MNKYYYIFDVWDKDVLDIEDAIEFRSKREINGIEGYDEWELESLVEDICKDYFHNRDGWEVADRWANYSKIIALWDDNKNFIGKFETTLEYDPYFCVSKVKE